MPSRASWMSEGSGNTGTTGDAVPRGPYRYRPDVLAVVWRHGILPTDRTPPELARGFVRELYKYEIRRLRERYLRKEFPKHDYASRVDALRRQYGVLALVPEQWLIARPA